MLYILDRVLRLFWFLLLGVTGLAVVAMLAAIFLSDAPVTTNLLTAPVSIETYEAATGTSDIMLRTGDRIAIQSVMFTSSDPAVLWPMALLVVAGIGLFLYGFSVLRAIVADAASDAPFTPANVTRIRQLALVALGVMVLQSIVPLASAGLAAIRLRGEAFHTEIALGFEPAALVLVLVLFALAEVFARGVALQQENDLTV